LTLEQFHKNCGRFLKGRLVNPRSCNQKDTLKTSRIILFALLLAGCTSTHQTASLTADQAKSVAIRLANEKAAATYHRQPFHDGQAPSFVAGHWTWRQLVTGDLEATVELAADGSTNNVTIIKLVEVDF
jgi:hypothetical protein